LLPHMVAKWKLKSKINGWMQKFHCYLLLKKH
ncbi:uncharacterized protein METZ01_LOCUS507592, partial [marine metagenome]